MVKCPLREALPAVTDGFKAKSCGLLEGNLLAHVNRGVSDLEMKKNDEDQAPDQAPPW